ncbi:DEAD/DEAH box helicase [Clostridium thailandense]|uniref:DEAD/DEAH box helicase n=1 Tax=Clostridium thailandense TaxID=2794346 RepID=UPI003989CEE6
MVVLKSYQRKAVEELLTKTSKLLENSNNRKLLVFKAPTGSGKTIIVSKYIEMFSKLKDKDFCFIWISIGKGHLHEQSRNKISSLLEGSPPCRLLEDVIRDGIIKRNSIVVVNWEKLNAKKNGVWDNLLMREGDEINFIRLLENTRRVRKIMLIIDESHNNTDTRTSKELMDIINPEILLQMSATPKYIPTGEDINDNRAAFVKIFAEEVIKAGVIKKEVLINDNIDDISLEEKNSLEIVLEMAIKRRAELSEAFSKEYTVINPLCLIQIPNAKRGEEVLNKLLTILKNKGISVESNNLAIWVNGNSKNLENIEDFNSKIDVLIFKMAIATGWDCPRAQVLLKVRESGSEIFDIQTIGRILRMPEQRYYKNEILNKAYIYTNNKDISVKVNNLSLIKFLKAKIKPEMKNIVLRSYYKEPSKAMSVKRKLLDPIFYAEVLKELNVSVEKSYVDNLYLLNKLNFNMKIDNLESQLMYDGRIETSKLDRVNVKIDHKDRKVKVYEFDIEETFTALVKTSSETFYPCLKELIYKCFCDILGYNLKETGIITKIQALFIVNYENFFKSILRSTIDKYMEEYKKCELTEVKEHYYNFSIKEIKLIEDLSYELFKSEKSIYDKCYLKKNRRQTEKIFENFLEKNGDKLLWWYKNDDRGKESFAVRYEYNDEPHAFYPDYIVLFKTGLTGIFEVKSENDREADTKTKAKSEYLQKYLKEEIAKGKNIIGGIVEVSDKNVRINNSREEYIVDAAHWEGFKC